MTRPFAAAVVIDGIDVIVTCDQRAAEQRFAGTRRDVPPAFGGPALGVLVAERYANAAASVVAQPEVGLGRRGRQSGYEPDRTGDAADGEMARQAVKLSVVRRGCRVIRHGLSTTMARKSFTLV